MDKSKPGRRSLCCTRSSAIFLTTSSAYTAASLSRRYPKLYNIIRYYLNPTAARAEQSTGMAQPPDAPWLSDIDFVAQNDAREMVHKAGAPGIQPKELNDI